MSQDLIIQIFREVIKTGLIVMAPALLISIVVGLIVSIFQAATQIHEQTLSFVPKLLLIAVFCMVGGGWMLNTMQDFTRMIFTQMLG